ncbi:hypothetical protein PHMEG_00015870 [Phytophthora megakarya]|uniref:Uncharacterized protein n=1 Tax=Phytophthora megakarya TaxID=4795 RepID=A0A225W0D6_9STRA|nr:hypothetical protein PHMEG_00015870 [Phytophthora megakarya]
MVCLWVGGRRWKQSRRRYKRAAIAAARRRGTQDALHRHNAWVHDSPQIGQAIYSVSWIEGRQVLGASAWGEQVFYRLKLRAFSMWDPAALRPACVIEECDTDTPIGTLQLSAQRAS